jgi:hydrogenase nickel incorporation protein HypA/HybF
MHELALAEAVVATALEAADREGLSEIVRIEVRLGELQQIRKDTFQFALSEVMPAAEPRLASTRIRVEVEPARFRCRPCGRAFSLNEETSPRKADQAEAIHFIPELAHAFLRCPACRSPDFEVVGGRGVSIATIEGE